MAIFQFEECINEETNPTRVKLGAMYTIPPDFIENEMDIQDLVEIGKEMREEEDGEVLTKAMIEDMFEKMSDEFAKKYFVRHLRLHLEHLIGPLNKLLENNSL